jgi:hypothetical protein
MHCCVWGNEIQVEIARDGYEDMPVGWRLRSQAVGCKGDLLRDLIGLISENSSGHWARHTANCKHTVTKKTGEALGEASITMRKVVESHLGLPTILREKSHHHNFLSSHTRKCRQRLDQTTGPRLKQHTRKGCTVARPGLDRMMRRSGSRTD